MKTAQKIFAKTVYMFSFMYERESKARKALVNVAYNHICKAYGVQPTAA